MNKLQNRRITVNSILQDFLFYEKASLKSSSYSTYSRIVDNHIIPEFGNRVISDIKLSEINKFLINKSEISELSSSTVCSIACVTCEYLRFASRLGIETANVKLVSRPKKTRHSVTIFTNAESNRIKKYCKDNLNTETLGIMICLYTGLRLGEVCALRWSDISFDYETLNVHKTVQRIKNPDRSSARKTLISIDSPKSESSVRTIPIPQPLLKLLKKLRPAKDCFIVSNCPEKPQDPRVFQAHYKKYLEFAGVEFENFHVLRHTFATTCANLNFDPKILSEILGHSDVSITFNTYIHPSMEIKKNLMNLLK